ncbi:GNAT family N-acetyltransferase [Congregicoccus parvus]|uniref:GNAT family N-acetyltransferase n=1 Tax=Congregicoccus parvus TaxID=3081749 RepID=UPI003FA612C5
MKTETTPTPASVFVSESDEDILRCFPCMAELRPHLVRESFVARVRAQQAESGYRLAAIAVDGAVVCVAGYRCASYLAWGRILYVDDLSTCASARRAGHGGRMLEWLFVEAKRQGCDAVHLDSGVHRHDAHRLYLAKRFDISSHHFSRVL